MLKNSVAGVVTHERIKLGGLYRVDLLPNIFSAADKTVGFLLVMFCSSVGKTDGDVVDILPVRIGRDNVFLQWLQKPQIQ